MNYYRRYSGDYLRDTARLSMLEHGAYCLMLDFYYSEESPLPLDRQEIYTMVRAMTPEQRKAVDKVLTRYFEEREDGWHNGRADEEIEVSQTARTNGKGGGRPPKKGTGSVTGGITEPETELLTEGGTGQVTGDGGGLVHPPSSILQPPSASLQPPSPNHQGEATRATQIAVVLRSLNVSEANAMHGTIQAWVRDGFSVAQCESATRCAIDERGQPQPSLNYINKILRDPNRKSSNADAVAEAGRRIFGGEREAN